MNSESKSRVVHENLDTTFVNLWALLRNLSQRGFIGRVRVELKDYTADVFMTGSNTPLVHEIDRAAGTDSLEEAALHRLVLRARESPGTISVCEGPDEAVAVRSNDSKSRITNPASADQTEPNRSQLTEVEDELAGGPMKASLGSSSVAPEASAEQSLRAEPVIGETEPEERVEWNDVVKVSGELIGGVERALNGADADFASLFSAARLELADDYTFLDPTSGGFEYSNSVATMRQELPISSYVAGLSEALRRIVDKTATGDRARRVRERVALDLSLVARKRREVMK